MSLSSSYHDYGGGAARPSNIYRQPAAGSRAPATRSSVHPVVRGSLGLRQPSAESTSTVATIVLGTASLARHAAANPASPRDASLSTHLPQPVVLRGGTATPPKTSPRQQQQQQQQRPAEAFISSRSSAASSRRPRRAAQPLPSHTNPTFVAGAEAAVGTIALTPRVSGVHRTSCSASVATLVATPRTSEARGNTATATPSLPSAARPSSSPRSAHLRPLSTSREADYVNLAYQRGFMGRFRCATPVVVRTAAAATPHTLEARKKGDTVLDQGEAAVVGQNGSEEGVQVDHAPSSTAENDAVVATGGSTAPEGGDALAEQAEPPPQVDAAATQSSSPPPPPLPPQQPPATSMLSRPRLRVGGSSASVVSASTTRGGRVRRLSASYLQGTAVPSQPAPSVTASSLPRRSMRTISASAGTRKAQANSTAVIPPNTASSAASTAANMAPLAQSGLHTSLWVATQEGAVEVRSLANPSTVLATLPRRDPRVLITALVEVSGNRVVAGSADGTLHVFDAVTMREVEGAVSATAPHNTAPPHTAAVTKLLYIASAPVPSFLTSSSGSSIDESSHHPTSALLLAASLDRTITVWAAASMTLLHRLKGNVRGVCALAATGSGGYAFSGSDEGTLRMWDVVRGVQWGVTKDERAQLGRRAREALPNSSAAHGDGAGAVTRVSHGVREYTGSSDNEDDDEEEEEVEDATSSIESLHEDNGIPLRSSRRAVAALASPRTNGAATPLPSHRRTPFANYPGSGSGAADAVVSHRRSQLGYGGVKAIPRAPPTTSTALALQDVGGALANRRRGPAGATAASSRSLPMTEDNFAPTDTATSFSPLRDGNNVLAGPGGGISPLRTALDYYDGEGIEKGREDEEAPSGGALDYGYAAPPPMRKHRGAKKKKTTTRRKARETSVSRGSSRGGGGATRKHKKGKKKAKKSPSPLRVGGAAAATTATTTSALEQRLSTWMRHYQQRVLLSAASHELTVRLGAGYDSVSAMNWPIEAAHTEYITALAVVEDRLLVSASCDATAKVFALPSGQYTRTLTSSRRMPLAGVLYDSSVCRLYTGFSDGAVAVYDVASGELPLLTQLQPTQTIVSCNFALLAMTPMQRFVYTARAAEEGQDAAVASVARFDKTTQAHGPHQTTSSYRVGQPSLRELNAAVSLQTLQQQRAANQAALSQRSVGGSWERRQLRGGRQCGVVLEQSYRRRGAGLFFLRWQRWLQRRAVLRTLKGIAETRAFGATQRLMGQYLHRWLDVVQQRSRTEAAAVLRRVQLQGNDAVLLAVGTEARRARWSTLTSTVAAMATARAAVVLGTAYRRWRDFQRRRSGELRQSVSYNTLLLSMNASAYAPGSRTLACLTDTATTRAHRTKALWLLTELTARWRMQGLRRVFFDRWRTCAAERQRVAMDGEASRSLVEPLSATLVQQRVVRLRYFAMWRDFALHVARSGQLRSERETLQTEWRTLQRALEAPTTVDELTAQTQVAERGAETAAQERAALAERVQTLADEDSALRTEEALRVLIAGYYVPDAAAAPGNSSTATATYAAFSSQSGLIGGTSAPLSARDTPMSSSLEVESTEAASRGRKTPPASTAVVPGAEDVHGQQSEEEHREHKLLREASAVLRALKGNCMQSARDDKLLARAHALALRLPVIEPLSNTVPTGGGISPSHRFGASHAHPQPQQQQRTTTTNAWSVSSARNGASGVVSSHTSPSASQRRRRHSTQSGGSMSSLTSAGNISNLAIPAAQAAAAAAAQAAYSGHSTAVNSNTTVTTPRSSAAQMWAAQPAEESYPSLADAFNAIYAHLLSLLYSAAMECGVTAHVTSRSAATSATATAACSSERRTGGSGRMTPRGSHHNQADGLDQEDVPTEGELHEPAVAPSWLVQVALKQRRVMVGEVLKLVTLFDSFAAHSDLPVERAGSISTRGVANTRALPLSSLCSATTAQSLLRHAAVLLELVDPQLWPRQLKLNYLQDAYAAAIAELNATVSSSAHIGDAYQHSSTIMTRSESEGGRDASPLPKPLMMRPPSLCLSPEVLQHAADSLQHATRATNAALANSARPPSSTATTTTTASGPGEQPAWRTTRKTTTPRGAAGSGGGGGVVPVHPTLLLSNPGSFLAGRSEGTEEEGQTSTPDPLQAHSTSFSHRTHSAVSTPRSYTPRAATPSVVNASSAVQKPYLGFRVNVTRDAHAARHTSTTISIRDVAAQYVNADGVEVDGPALVAGLQAGDQLVRFAGYAVTDLAAFNAVVSRHVHSGAELPVVVQRGAELLSTTIVVGTRIT